jgi:hypothetical protein
MSAFSQSKNLSIAVGVDVSEKFAVQDFQRGSFIATAVTTGDVNFDVSEDGTNWDTLTAADATFANITAPAANKPRGLPAGLFQFRYARFKTSVVQATAPAALTVRLLAN